MQGWLAAMTLAGVLGYDPKTGRFSLPPEHAGAVTQAGGPANMACLAQHVAVLGRMEDKVVDCFNHGGGLAGKMFISTFSTMYCIPISLADAGMGLGAMWGTEVTLRMLAEAGLSTQVVHLEGDWSNLYVSTLA